MFVIRSAQRQDLESIYKLAQKVFFINLPANKAILKKKLNHSRKSFQQRLPNKNQGEFIFILEDVKNKKIVGCCAIKAQHGSKENPDIYFQIINTFKKSKSLKTTVNHQKLRLKFDTSGPSEIGSLVLTKKYRGHREKLGKFLSYSRFVYISANRNLFRTKILADLMPPLTKNGSSLIWEELGQKFTKMSYKKADELSRINKEFITSLFPTEDIYTCFLSKQAQNNIGVVGEKTIPARNMLSKIGFKFSNRVDPFDGGAHYWAKINDISLVKNTKKISEISKCKAPQKKSGILLVLDNENKPFFFQVKAKKIKTNLFIQDNAVKKIESYLSINFCDLKTYFMPY